MSRRPRAILLTKLLATLFSAFPAKLLWASFAFLLLQPALVLIHAAGELSAAHTLQRLSDAELQRTLATFGPGDPVYKGIALWTITRIEPAGLAVIEPLGGWLHTHWP